MAMPKVEANGIRLNYEMRGRGPLVVINHGIHGDLTRFRSLVERLKDDFTVLTWDNRGCGESDAGGPYNLQLFSEDLHGLLRALDVRQCMLVGVSWGGVLAQRLTPAHPEFVRGLV